MAPLKYSLLNTIYKTIFDLAPVNSSSFPSSSLPCILHSSNTKAFATLFMLFCLELVALYVHAKSLQSCPTVCDPMHCSQPGSSVQGVLQARILEWVAVPFCRGSSWPRDWTGVSYKSPILAGRFFILVPPGKPLLYFISPLTFPTPYLILNSDIPSPRHKSDLHAAPLCLHLW